MADWTDARIQRRCISYSAFRLDGLADLYARAPGASIFDVGCNRGWVSFDLCLHGATLVHGVDYSDITIATAREWYADFRNIESRFEVVDLREGAGTIKRAFGTDYRKEYDIVLMLAVYHKLRRVMALPALLHLVDHLAHHCGKFFVWRGSRGEIEEFEPAVIAKGFRRVHYSEICLIKRPDTGNIEAQPAAIWAKDHLL
jgi:SAM-dependent methyltransferase